MKTNILYIFHVSFLGGGSLCLLNVIKELDKKKYNPIVLLKNWGPVCIELKKAGANILIEPSLNTVPYNRSLFEINSIRQIVPLILSIKKVKYWIKKTDANIVHINTMMMYPYAIPAFKLKRKVIIHIREHWPINEHSFQFKFAKKIIDKYTDLIISINKTSAEIINLPNKTEIIYDWIDFKGREKFIDFKDIFGNNHESLKVFLFLGGMQKIKGSLQIVKTFSKNIKSKDARLLFVGSDSKLIVYKGIKGAIKKILHLFRYFTYSDTVKKIALQDDRIVFIPPTNQVKSLFEQSYCTLVFPTIPHAIIPIAESIYLGKPIISAETPEAIEYSNEGKGAFLFKINDEEDFAKELLHVSRNKEKIYNRTRKNSDFVREMFSKEKNSSKLNQIYSELTET